MDLGKEIIDIWERDKAEIKQIWKRDRAANVGKRKPTSTKDLHRLLNERMKIMR